MLTRAENLQLMGAIIFDKADLYGLNCRFVMTSNITGVDSTPEPNTLLSIK